MMADEAGTSSAGTRTSDRRPSSKAYEVFLNFRGPDSRDTVANVLKDALDRAGVRVFYDDESIRHGEVIAKELEEAIRNSKIYIPIFSKDYASSRWCLRELDLIIESWEDSLRNLKKRKTILPIFYDVDVSTDLKLKSDLYTSALQKHKEELGGNHTVNQWVARRFFNLRRKRHPYPRILQKLREDRDPNNYMVNRWEDVLRIAATIKGRDLRNHGLVEIAELIAQEVSSMLLTRSDSEELPDDYVGIDHTMGEIMKLLDLDANDVRFVSIHGLGGVGKTTLARLVFNRISSSFGRTAFLSNIREKCRSDADILHLQQELISEVLTVNASFFIQDVDCGLKTIKERLNDEKVLIVLDDLDNGDQLLKLAGETSWFGIGSRIITTTTDIGITPKGEGYYQYKLQVMEHDAGLKLFSRRVFNSVLPPKEYDEFSREVVGTAGGLPLAINVIAALFKNNWEDAWDGIFEKLKEVVHKDVRERLMISYNRLDKHEKEIFLDIACFFVNKEIEDATYYWESRKLYPKRGIKVLEDMSLIEIVDGNKLWMHDLLRDLGRNLADEENDDPARRSRLWLPEVALKVVHRRKGTKKVVALNLGMLDSNCTFNLEHFAGLTNLNFLELSGGNLSNEDFKEVFSELKWFSWDDCSPKFQATNLCFEDLVVLTLSENLITDDWGGWRKIKEANKLKVLKCIYCRFLTKSPDFSTFPALEKLVFRNCASLTELSPTIAKLKHLTYLEITNPLIYKQRLHDEYILYQLQEDGPQILPDSIGNLRFLSVLKLKFVNLSKIPDSIGKLFNLKYLCLWCPKLKELPESIQCLPLLEELDISFTAITKLPTALMHRMCLKVFKYDNCQLEDANNVATIVTSLPSSVIPMERPRSMFNPVDTGRQVDPGTQRSMFNPVGTERIESLKNT